MSSTLTATPGDKLAAAPRRRPGYGKVRRAPTRIERPRLPFPVSVEADGVVVDRDGVAFVLQADSLSPADLKRLLDEMDGTRDVAELHRLSSRFSEDAIRDLIESLDRAAMLDGDPGPEVRSGIDALLEIEDLTNDLLYKTLYRNVFWTKMHEATPDTPLNVLYGMCIENYHFLHRESYFDAPVLSYVPNNKVRLLINEFYDEEYGHDEILLRALNSIGISREELRDTMPLPETMGLCHTLAYLSMYDPIFFFTTLGILEGQELKEGTTDSYLACCKKLGVSRSFWRPIEAHANINLKGNHGSLTRMIFSNIPSIDAETMRRLRSQTYLFVEMYDSFYSAIWNHYSRTDTLLRRVSAV